LGFDKTGPNVRESLAREIKSFNKKIKGCLPWKTRCHSRLRSEFCRRKKEEERKKGRKEGRKKERKKGGRKEGV
jgi:hypothetical protein